MSPSSPQPVIALLGPTASGKSALAMALARHQPRWEIVSVDSMQCYRGLDIGTAKPTQHERREVPHHLIDVVEPYDTWSVAEFQRELTLVRRDITRRGKATLMVGGTGLHLRAAVDGLDLPGDWPEVRQQFEQQANMYGPAALHEHLTTLDPDAAAKIDPLNTRRLVRALEVITGSGRLFSSYGGGLDTYPPTEVVQIGLRWPREQLERRITERVNIMVEQGWLDEVSRLLDGDRPLSRTAAVAVGYRELAEHLRGDITLQQAVDAIVIRTRQLAARQMRWFRRDPRIHWIDVETDPLTDAFGQLVDLVGS